MGPTVSKQSQTIESFNTNVAKSLSSTNFNNTLTAVQGGSDTQTLEISGLYTCGGDIEINNFYQSIVKKYDYSGLTSGTKVDDIKTALTAALSTAIENTQDVKAGVGSLVASDNSQNYTDVTELISETVRKIDINQVQSIAQAQNNNQTLTISNLTSCSVPPLNTSNEPPPQGYAGIPIQYPLYGSGNVTGITYSSPTGGKITITNLGQEIRSELIASQVATLATTAFEETTGGLLKTIDAQNSQSITNDALSFLGSIAGIITMVVIGLVIVVAIPLIVVFVKRKKAQQQRKDKKEDRKDAMSDATTSSFMAENKTPPPTSNPTPVLQTAPPTISPTPITVSNPPPTASASPLSSSLSGIVQQGVKFAKSPEGQKVLSGFLKK